MRLSAAKIISGLALLVAFSASAQGTIQARTEEQTAAFRAVVRAWSLPPDLIQETAAESGPTPADLASAALLWRNGGPPPMEGWRLRLSEKSWESAARKAGAPVDALLKEYRSLVNEQTRGEIAGTREEWIVLAEIRTLERLTGRGAKAVAAELTRRDFQTLLLAALPAAGPPLSPPHSPASPAQAPPNQWQAADPMAPILGEGAPKNTGTIGAGAPPRSR